ncbi:MAG: maltose alpha-D-glucosyltransferase [Actinomycetota bacterium]
MRERTISAPHPADAAQWYRDAVIYEVHVRAFQDSNADGIGDFRGLTRKLGYLQDLGVTAVWLLPFYPSPLRDDGYDIAQYKAIHPAYGTIRDFRAFMREARRQGLRVITELVLNHTSDQHPWLQRARRSPPGSTYRDFYVWSDTPDRYRDARIIFKDFESSNWAWDPVAKAYYWHRFYSHQPDLNFENPEVRRAMFEVVDFWLDMGVDGLRLDAVPYLFEQEGTNCENLPQTYEFLRELRAHVDANHSNRMLLAEANQWPEDAAAYFGHGDRCHMAFHFPLMPRMFMGIRMEDRFPMVDILNQTPPIPESCQWAIFLRNHDELTLEMVTDEERDYMYRVYADDPQARINLGIRRRLAPLLGNDRRMIELMNGLLFSLPGTPVIYYGDEIGMGDNIYLGDRNGVRTPMHWSADRNAGFSDANPHRLYLPVSIDPEYNAGAINVEAQQDNPHSLLWWMKRMIALRKRFRAFGRGSLEFLYPENRKVLAFLRRHEGESVLVVANLSRHAQYVELDLSAFKGMVPVELFGRTEFPPIGDLPYLLTLAPHIFYWFALEPQRAGEQRGGDVPLPVLQLEGDWRGLFTEGGRGLLEEALPSYLAQRRWFRSKARKIKTAEVVDVIALLPGGGNGPISHVTFVHVEFTEGDPETYVVPLSYRVSGAENHEVPAHAVVAKLRTPAGEGLLFDSTFTGAFGRELLDAMRRRRVLSGRAGRVVYTPMTSLRQVGGMATSGRVDPTIMQAEQTNTSLVFGDELVLKLFRRMEDGVNPDLEIGRHLTEAMQFEHVPPVAGAIEYHGGRASPSTIGILQRFVPNEGDAWAYTLDMLDSYVEQVRTRLPEDQGPPLSAGSALDLARRSPPDVAHELIGSYLESARLLGRRTAELHAALAADRDNASFAPERFSTLYQRSVYQSARALTAQTYRLIRTGARRIPQTVQILDLEDEIMGRFRRLLEVKIEASRIRVHGDYHLGQVLWTGRDFVIIDFEGEPDRPLGERRIKRSPLRDVAGMLRSFHYAAYTALSRQTAEPNPENPAFLEPWILLWYQWVAATFVQAYLDAFPPNGILPPEGPQMRVMLDVFLLEKALYELRYELNHRPDWVRIPLHGILQQLETTV